MASGEPFNSAAAKSSMPLAERKFRWTSVAQARRRIGLSGAVSTEGAYRSRARGGAGELEAVILTALEAWMTLPGYPEKRWFYEKGYAAGEARGTANALLSLLDARGISIPVDRRARVLACGDVKRLTAWIRRAALADGIEAVFAEETGA
jgi:hypothetical protein